MSALTQAKTVLTNKTDMVKALIAMGFTQEQIQLAETNSLTMYDYHNHGTKVCMLIKRETLRQQGIFSYSDLGVTLEADGSLAVHGSDLSGQVSGRRFSGTSQFVDVVCQQYAKARLTDELQALGYYLDTTNLDPKTNVMKLQFSNPFAA